MKRFTQHPNLLKGILLGFLMLIVVAGPFSVLSGTNLLSLNQAYAQTGAVQVAAQSTGNPLASSGPTSCDSLVNFFASPVTCIGRSIGAFIASALVFVASWVLTIAGILFDWILDKTIVHFGDWINNGVITAINGAWTAFRDIANILIIGIFTFVAISIILGIKEFGQKKMIARVLIIAVLINFSLLFTKMAIDASNFVSTQLYAAASLPGGGSPATGTATSYSVSAPNGIAGAFLNYAGVSGFTDTFSSVKAASDKYDNGFLGFLNGLFVALLYFGAAYVLFYGSYLLITRGVLLIFLMITSSIAFASYLVPKWQTGGYGWDAWLSSLIWSATLAPILIFFLWMTLDVGNAMRANGSGTLGDLVANPQSTADINSLFSYFVIFGLLFTAFKLSSKWASKAGGFNMASLVPGIGLGLGGALTGLVGRNTLGWAARTSKRAMVNAGWTGKEGNEGVMGTVRRNATIAANRLGRTSYNPLKTKLAQTAAGGLGVPKMFMSKDALGMKSFEDKMKQKALAADEVARQISPSNEQKLQAADTEGRRRFREQKQQTEKLIHGQESTRDAIEQQKKQAQPERAGAEDALKKERAAQIKAEDDHTSKLRIQEQRAATATNPNDRQAAQAQAASLLASRRQAMRGEADRIERAKAKITQLDDAAKQAAATHPDVLAFNAAIQDATEKLSELGGSEKGSVKKVVGENEEALRKALLWDKRATPNIKSAIDEHRNIENWKHFRATEPGGGGHGAPPAAPAAPAPAAAAHTEPDAHT